MIRRALVLVLLSAVLATASDPLLRCQKRLGTLTRWAERVLGTRAGECLNVNTPPVYKPVDWGASMLAWWPLDEASGTRKVGGGTCGHACDLTDSTGTPGHDATHVQEGTASLAVVGASTQTVSCPYVGGCMPLRLSGSVTWFGWVRTATTGITPFWLESSGSYDADSFGAPKVYPAGAFGSVLSGGTLDCDVVNADQTITTEFSAVTVAADTYYHHACVWDDSNQELHGYTNGVASGSTATATAPGYVVSNSPRFVLGSQTAPFSPIATWDGELDEVGVYPGVMAASSVCRICSCGITGSLCSCSQATPTSYRPCYSSGDCDSTAYCESQTCTSGARNGLACTLDSTDPTDGCGAGATCPGCCVGACTGRRVSACGTCTLPTNCNQATP